MGAERYEDSGDADYLDGIDKKRQIEGNSRVNVNPEVASINEQLFRAKLNLSENSDKYRDFMSRFYRFPEPQYILDRSEKKNDRSLLADFTNKYNQTKDKLFREKDYVDNLLARAEKFAYYGGKAILERSDYKKEYSSWKNDYKTYLKWQINSLNKDDDGVDRLLLDMDTAFADMGFVFDGVAVVDDRERMKNAKKVRVARR